MFSQIIKSGDWKGEKYVFVIEYEKEGDFVKVEVFVGKEILYLNIFEYYIVWIQFWFYLEDGVFLIFVGKVEFSNYIDLFIELRVVFFFRIQKKGKFYVFSYCNIYGFWENEVIFE